jgi:hypothetical protein
MWKSVGLGKVLERTGKLQPQAQRIKVIMIIRSKEIG